MNFICSAIKVLILGSIFFTGTNSLAIVGGQFATESDLVSVSTVSLTINARSFCTGTLITPVHVITAAHCISPGRQFSISFGLDALSFIPRSVKSVRVHPGYTGLQVEQGLPVNDIALVRLNRAAPTGFSPATITNEFVNKDDPLILAGFGLTSFFGGNSGRLKFVDTHVQTRLDEQIEFLFGPTPGQSACRGDSGGPAYLVKDGQLLLAGVTSRGVQGKKDELGRPIGCTGEGFYTDVLGHINWIIENL